ncbi:hypothetical protein CHF27_012605 [Romboutsia maritimum]|uniref:Uncharacterized protein n=1 Tax=Romboutsia maritimum TaxID=2020948 RepID=A0A371IQ24_9FIRM|nr:hypothetical protein [Romboutsia maritimum]RDY22581.1 hypothetical protein CHF27_012605 [Romboutsia maritimum]
MNNIQDIKKVIRSYNFHNKCDYIRNIGEAGWTDIYMNKIEKNLSINSKYIIKLDSSLEGKNILLYTNNLASIYDEINKELIPKIEGYDINRNRLHGYYRGNGKILIGKKGGKNIEIQMEELSLDRLLRKVDYRTLLEDSDNKDKHQLLQSFIVDLGVSFNLLFKVAKNDESYTLNSMKLKEYAHLKNSDLNIFNLIEEKDNVSKESIKKIDRTDVIWVNKISNDITDAFEVELSSRMQVALNRLNEIDKLYAYKNKDIRLVIVSNENGRRQVERELSTITYNSLFDRNNLYFLSLDDLIKLLESKKCAQNKKEAYFYKLYQFKNRNI